MLNRVGFTIIVLASLMMSLNVSAGSSQRVGLLGIRGGTDVGWPALHWEYTVSPQTAVTVSVSQLRAFSGLRLQVGGKLYSHTDYRGGYIYVSGGLAQGETGYAEWASLDAGVAGGYSWAVLSELRAMVELGTGVRVTGAQDIYGVRSRAVRQRYNVGIGLLWYP